MYNQSEIEKSVSEFDWMLPLIYLKSATAICVHIIKTGCGQADAHRLVAIWFLTVNMFLGTHLTKTPGQYKYRYIKFTFLKSLNSDEKET